MKINTDFKQTLCLTSARNEVDCDCTTVSCVAKYIDYSITQCIPGGTQVFVRGGGMCHRNGLVFYKKFQNMDPISNQKITKHGLETFKKMGI